MNVHAALTRVGRMPWQNVLDSVTSIVLLIAAGLIINNYAFSAQQKAGPRIPRDPVSIDGTPILGNPRASVAIIEFSDFQCPFCGRFVNQTLPSLKDAYIKSGRAFIAFRNLPLTDIHPFAMGAAEAAVCAGRQGRFWEAHDQLYKDQRHLSPDDLSAVATQLSLDGPGFKTCVAGYAPGRLQQDIQQGQTLGIHSTPTFLIGTPIADGRVVVRQVLNGARPFREFQLAIETMGAAPR